jgi:hypothetical protein
MSNLALARNRIRIEIRTCTEDEERFGVYRSRPQRQIR